MLGNTIRLHGIGSGAAVISRRVIVSAAIEDVGSAHLGASAVEQSRVPILLGMYSSMANNIVVDTIGCGIIRIAENPEDNTIIVRPGPRAVVHNCERSPSGHMLIPIVLRGPAGVMHCVPSISETSMTC